MKKDVSKKPQRCGKSGQGYSPLKAATWVQRTFLLGRTKKIQQKFQKIPAGAP